MTTSGTSRPVRVFVPANTMQGRRIASSSARIIHPAQQSQDIAEWNAAVEQRKLERAANRNRATLPEKNLCDSCAFDPTTCDGNPIYIGPRDLNWVITCHEYAPVPPADPKECL